MTLGDRLKTGMRLRLFGEVDELPKPLCEDRFEFGCEEYGEFMAEEPDELTSTELPLNPDDFRDDDPPRSPIRAKDKGVVRVGELSMMISELRFGWSKATLCRLKGFFMAEGVRLNRL